MKGPEDREIADKLELLKVSGGHAEMTEYFAQRGFESLCDGFVMRTSPASWSYARQVDDVCVCLCFVLKKRGWDAVVGVGGGWWGGGHCRCRGNDNLHGYVWGAMVWRCNWNVWGGALGLVKGRQGAACWGLAAFAPWAAPFAWWQVQPAFSPAMAQQQQQRMRAHTPRAGCICRAVGTAGASRQQLDLKQTPPIPPNPICRASAFMPSRVTLRP